MVHTFSQQSNSEFVSSDKAACCKCTNILAGTGGTNAIVVDEETTPKTLLTRCGCEGGGKGALIQNNKSATLGCSNTQTLFQPNGKEYIVRRLTPTECQRLQGFPDGWADGVKGESDSKKYRLWGNGMALPNMLFFIKRIAERDLGALKGERTNETY